MLTGFAMAFYMLLPMVPAFSSPISAALKVFVMMLGEFQMEDYFTVEQVRYTKKTHKNILLQTKDWSEKNTKFSSRQPLTFLSVKRKGQALFPKIAFVEYFRLISLQAILKI